MRTAITITQQDSHLRTHAHAQPHLRTHSHTSNTQHDTYTATVVRSIVVLRIELLPLSASHPMLPLLQEVSSVAYQAGARISILNITEPADLFNICVCHTE